MIPTTAFPSAVKWAPILLAAVVIVTGTKQTLAITFTTIDYPGATSTTASGIQGNTIVGRYVDASNAQHGFVDVDNGATYTPLDVPSTLGSNTNARGISRGNIAGFYSDSSSVFHGFEYNGATYMTVDNPSAGTAAGQGTRAFGIDGTNIVGDFLNPSGLEQGYLFNGTYHTIAPGPTVQSAAFGISGSTIVGVYVGVGSSVLQGMIYDGSYSTLNDPSAGTSPGQGTQLFGIDGKNIVGTYIDPSGANRGFYYDGTSLTFTKIDFPGGTNTVVEGISGNEMVGRYTDANGGIHGFSAVIPEPSSIVLAALGFVGLLAVRHGRARKR
jgi:hypothetical protein